MLSFAFLVYDHLQKLPLQEEKQSPTNPQSVFQIKGRPGLVLFFKCEVKGSPGNRYLIFKKQLECCSWLNCFIHGCSFWSQSHTRGNYYSYTSVFATILLIPIKPSSILLYILLICIVFSTNYIPKPKGIEGALQYKIPTYSART